jgi:hypothetical protein
MGGAFSDLHEILCFTRSSSGNLLNAKKNVFFGDSFGICSRSTRHAGSALNCFVACGCSRFVYSDPTPLSDRTGYMQTSFVLQWSVAWRNARWHHHFSAPRLPAVSIYRWIFPASGGGRVAESWGSWWLPDRTSSNYKTLLTYFPISLCYVRLTV